MLAFVAAVAAAVVVSSLSHCPQLWLFSSCVSLSQVHWGYHHCDSAIYELELSAGDHPTCTWWGGREIKLIYMYIHVCKSMYLVFWHAGDEESSVAS